MQFHHPLSTLFMFARSSGAAAHRAELQRETERLAALPRPNVRWFDAAESLAFVEPVVGRLLVATVVGRRDGRALTSVFRARSACRAWRAHLDCELTKHVERHLPATLAAFTDGQWLAAVAVPKWSRRRDLLDPLVVFALRCDDVGLVRAVHRWIGVCETPGLWAAIRRGAASADNRAAAWLCGVLHVAPRRLVFGQR
jgi:hypothetical protein